MLLKTEEQIIKSLKKYVKEETIRLNFLDKYVSRLKQEYEIAVKDVPYYLGNPINAFTIIKRLGPDLEQAEQILRNKTDLKPPNAVFPTSEDMKSSIYGVVGLIDVYGLDVAEVANGNINISDSAPLTASDCYSIGTTLYQDEEYQDAIPWLQAAYDKLEGAHCDVCPVDIVDVVDCICKCYHELENIEKFIKWTERRIFLRPKDHESMVLAKYLDALRHKENVREKNAKQGKSNVETNVQPTGDATSICLGRRSINSTIRNMNLHCYYAHGPHPVLKLAPLKAEVLHQDPDVTMFHGVVSRGEIDDIQAIATPLLWENTKSDPPEYRNAEAVILDEVASPVAGWVSRRCLALSGLSAEDSGNLKVVSYGVGGMHWKLWDSPPAALTQVKSDESDWDTHGSIIIYLTDVEQGGATIFPLLDLTICPKKGAALFWLNRFPSGAMDLLTLHGACPVFRGSKWIAVKSLFIKDRCPAWYRNGKPVTAEVYKEILEDRERKYRSFKGVSEGS
ncbi:prolyl 4-hydroxylase subunit alpha-1 [Phthorimaea operculella]|nr:prolyl 4-hydroxylase subunit alpha-1 [Phthorimaea operculella]